jgi:hypothetical protein
LLIEVYQQLVAVIPNEELAGDTVAAFADCTNARAASQKLIVTP